MISILLENLLIDVFNRGLGEDEHFRAINNNLDLEKIKIERSKIIDNTLEAKLLDLMIEDFEWKKE